MKAKLFTPILLLMFTPAAYGEEPPVISITSKCIEETEVYESNIESEWILLIKLNEQMKREMLNFTEENIGIKVRIVDGSGIDLIGNGVVVREKLAGPIQIAGHSSKKEAITKRDSILAFSGSCISEH